MKVSLSSVQHLESLLDRLGAYGTTTTSLVLSSPVRHRLVRPPAASSEPAPRPAPDGAGAGVVGVNRTPRLASKV